MNALPPIRFGLTGLGGYASYICDTLLDAHRARHPAAQLVAVCDPQKERFPARVAHLEKKGIRVFTSFDDLLDQEVEAVWLPLPIDLHRSFTEHAFAAGKAILCEKPAAGCVDDVDAMIRARDRAKLPIAIGFQDIYEPVNVAVKERLVAGEFGKIRSIQVIGCWPRSEAYFSRNDWAGRMHRNGVWIMDSPAVNAMAHFLHLALFFAGETLQESTTPIEVSAELYRANRIENYDTCSYRLMLPGDVQLHLAYTHACGQTVEPRIVIQTEKARIKFVSGLHIDIESNGESETIPLSNDSRANMMRVFQRWVRNGLDSAVGATLEMARAHTVTVNAASEATAITDVPQDEVEKIRGDDEIALNAIRGIIPAMQHAMQNRCLLHETRMLPWTLPAGSRDTRDYSHFAGPHGTPAVEVTTHVPSRSKKLGV
jgi:predicted dehydrogenase